jgi:tetratricopeptide (TPR) repeat protein
MSYDFHRPSVVSAASLSFQTPMDAPLPVSRRLRAAVGLLLCSFAILAGCSGPELRRAKHMGRGNEYLAAGKLDKALVEYRNVLQLAPGDITARIMIGHVAEKQGNIREAFGDYQAAIDLDPGNALARASLARIYVFADEPQRALELIESALMQFPNDVELLTVRGAARAELLDMSEAFEDAQRAVQLAPKDENAIALLASLYQRSGAGDKAVELLRSSLAALPNSIDLRQVLASLYRSQGQTRLAEVTLLQIVDLAPNEFSFRYKLAQFYLGDHRLDDAERVLKDAVAARPKDDAAKLAYAEFLNLARSPAQAELALRGFIARAPHDYELQLGLGEQQQKNGDVKGALATYRGILVAAGDRAQGLGARDRMSAILVTQGHLDESLALVNEVLQKNPRDNDALLMRGNIELERGDSGAAIADLRAVLREQPDDVSVMRTIARAYLGRGDLGLAEESLRDAIKSDPKDPAVHIELAQIMMQTNRFPAAVAMLEETVLEAPTNLAAREALAHAYLGAREYPMAARATEDLKLAAPKRSMGWYLAGLVALAQNRPDEARSQFERALEVEPNTIDVIVELVRLEIAHNQTSQAFERIKAVLADEPGNAIAHNILGELYIATKDAARAIEELKVAVQLAPNLWLPHRNLALAQIESGDLAAATRTYEEAIPAIGRSPNLVIDLAALYEKQGRIDDAIREYEGLQQHNPQSQVAGNNLAMLLVTYKTDQASLDRARDLSAAFISSNNGALLDTHGWVRFKRGEFQDAVATLTRAAARTPDSKVIRYHLGMAELQLGQRARARADLESALSGSANFSGADEARSALKSLKEQAG